MLDLLKRLPVFAWIPLYERRNLKGDLSAGITLAIMLIPQGMAYAILAGLPAVYGLYAAVAPLIVYTFLGSSRHLAIGVTAIDSIIIAVGVGAIAGSDTSQYIELVLLLSLMVGAMHLAAGVLRLGFLVNLISRPVIVGFTSAVVIVIGLSQVGNIVGVPIERTQLIDVLFREFFRVIPQAHSWTLVLGLGSLGLLMITSRWRRFPGAFVAVALSTLAAYYFRLDMKGVAVVGEIVAGLPGFSVPVVSISRMESLLPTAAALALIQFANVYALGRVFASRYKYSIRPNMELIALGSSNIIGGFFQSYPISGSYSRSAISAQSGGSSPLVNLFAAIMVAAALLFVTPLLRYVPIATLAAIVMVAVFGMFRPVEFKRLWKMKWTDGLIAVLTFIITLVLGVKYGILIGVAASVVAIMSRISRPNIAVLGHIRGTRSFRDISSSHSATVIPGIFIVRMDASFTFANAELLREVILRRCNDPSVRSVVLDASTLNDIDTTAVGTLTLLIDTLRSRGIELYMTGLHGDADRTIKNSVVSELLGDKRVFLSPHRAVKHILDQEGRVEWYNEQTRPIVPVSG